MGLLTNIAWTDRTWNPWQGCRKVSPGCKFCYMFREKRRYGQNPDVVVRSKPHTFNQPLSRKWSSPAKVFVCSWSDFFIEEADPWRAEAWDIIRKAKHLTFQICTKLAERIAECLPSDWGEGWPHVWLGVTAEDQARADQRIPLLLEVPAAVRFASMEPLLGHVRGSLNTKMAGLDWVIVGAESGSSARPMMAEWALDIMDQCRAADVAIFVKQIHMDPFRLSTDPSEWPECLRVREFPEVRRA